MVYQKLILRLEVELSFSKYLPLDYSLALSSLGYLINIYSLITRLPLSPHFNTLNIDSLEVFPDISNYTYSLLQILFQLWVFLILTHDIRNFEMTQ